MIRFVLVATAVASLQGLVGCGSSEVTVPRAYDAQIERTDKSGYAEIVQHFFELCVMRSPLTDPLEAGSDLTVRKIEDGEFDAFSTDKKFTLRSSVGSKIKVKTSDPLKQSYNCDIFVNTYYDDDTIIASEIDKFIAINSVDLPNFSRNDGALLGTAWMVKPSSAPLIAIGRNKNSRKLRLMYVGSIDG